MSRAKYAGLPRAFMPGVVALATERTQARLNGASAARHYLSRDCNPFNEGSALHASWDLGWRRTHSKREG